jgi:hypothetical protein
MWRRCLTIISGRPAALLSGALALAVFGCSGERTGAGPRPPMAAPSHPDIGEDAPINLTYVCGNRFVVTNAQSFPITVTYRVAESEEEGTAHLAPAPRTDPAITEQTNGSCGSRLRRTPRDSRSRRRARATSRRPVTTWCSS